MAKSTMNKSVGGNIRRLRQSNKWSQQIIAERLNISIPAYSKIETGVTDVNLSRLEQIADLFNTGISTLFTDGETDAPIVSANYVRMEKDLHEAEKVILELQRKVIQLYDQIHKTAING